MLRKTKVFELKEEFEDLMRDFSELIKKKYFTQVKFVIERERRQFLERYKKAGQDKIVTLQPKESVDPDAIKDSGAKANPFWQAVFEFMQIAEETSKKHPHRPAFKNIEKKITDLTEAVEPIVKTVDLLVS